ncbi:MAG TPA: carbon monoxide dehydrogenase subunit G [Longimicrobium sp.]|nr:carbon monoxide dehydrogenase subunit G [Longimicrobium sp.]
MIVTGEHTFPGTRQHVWDLLQDPAVLVKAMPGARRLDITGDGTYEGVVRIGVGPVTAAEWRLTVELHDREEPASYVMHVDTKGTLGFTRGTATVALVEVEEGTRMLYHADLSVGGKVASVGQRLLDQVAKMLTKQGLNALNKEMEARLLSNVVVEPFDSDDAEALDHISVADSGIVVDAEIEVADTEASGDADPASIDAAAGAGDGSPGLEDEAEGDARADAGEGGR